MPNLAGLGCSHAGCHCDERQRFPPLEALRDDCVV
jgi:hypothetical protein